MKQAILILTLVAALGKTTSRAGSAPRKSTAALPGSSPVAQFYYVDDAAALQSLEKNGSRVSLLSPVWIVVDAAGGVRIASDGKVERLAAEHRFKLMPVIVNEDFRLDAARAVLRDEAKMDGLAAQLVRTAETQRWDGLQLDFENLERADRDAYSRFAEKLGAALRPRGMALSVAVPAPVYGIGPVDKRPGEWLPTPRSEGFDYERLAQAASFLTLMAYDQYVMADTPGPIAGIEWVEACVKKVLETVPASKVTLGLPFYHRRWTGNVVTTGSWVEAQAASVKANVAPRADPLHQEPVVRFWEGGVQSIVWFHDAKSLSQRLDLVKRYNLRGFSAWRLGQEDPSVWTETFGGRR